MVEWFFTAEDFLLGRTTYEIFEAWRPSAPQEGDPIATALNRKTKHVASRTLTSVDWNGTARLSEGNLPAAVRELEQADGGELQVHGSAGLVQTLLREDLVDELRLITYPVVVGGGKRLSGDGAVPQAWRLLSSTAVPAGAVASVYERDGEPRAGEFTLNSTRCRTRPSRPGGVAGPRAGGGGTRWWRRWPPGTPTSTPARVPSSVAPRHSKR